MSGSTPVVHAQDGRRSPVVGSAVGGPLEIRTINTGEEASNYSPSSPTAPYPKSTASSDAPGMYIFLTADLHALPHHPPSPLLWIVRRQIVSEVDTQSAGPFGWVRRAQDISILPTNGLRQASGLVDPGQLGRGRRVSVTVPCG